MALEQRTDAHSAEQKEHGPSYRKGVCCRRKVVEHKYHQHKRLRFRRYYPKCRQVVLLASPSNSQRDTASPSLSSYCILQKGERKSYTWSERIVLPDYLTRGRGGERLRKKFCCTWDSRGLYSIHIAWKTSSCHLFKLLRFSVSRSHSNFVSAWYLLRHSYFGTSVANVTFRQSQIV